MADDPRKPSILDKLFRRQAEPTPPVWSPADEPEEKKRRKIRQEARPGPEEGHIPSAFYAGQPLRRARARPKTEFADRSGSARFKKDEEFERRFKGEVARTEARMAIEDATAVQAALKDQFIKDVQAWHADLRYYTSFNKPAPPELGYHLNQKYERMEEKFQREMQEADDRLKSSLNRAEFMDVVEDRKRQLLLGYTPNRPFEFMDAATKPMPPGPPRPAPAPPRTVLDHPFNDAVTAPPASSVPRTVLDHPFNDAVTAPDPLDAWFLRFRQNAPTPEPAGQPLGPSL